MKNPISPNFKTEYFPLMIIGLSFLASLYFRAIELRAWPLILILIYAMFLSFPYFKINHQESAALKEDWHKAKDISLSFMFILQVAGSSLLCGSKVSLWTLPILFLLLIVSLIFQIRKVLKYRKK